MTTAERACQIWSVLAWAARCQQTLTYSQLSDLTGLAAVGLGKALEPIQSYCLEQGLPPLTILAVNREGVPGSGFTAASATELAKKQIEVFAFDWLKQGNPQPDALDEAVRRRPSNG